MGNQIKMEDGNLYRDGVQLLLDFSDSEQMEVLNTSTPDYLFNWISRVIETSITMEHMQSCNKLKDLFVQKFPDDEKFIVEINLKIHDRMSFLNYI
jgi:hypothetical protein